MNEDQAFVAEAPELPGCAAPFDPGLTAPTAPFGPGRELSGARDQAPT